MRPAVAKELANRNSYKRQTDDDSTSSQSCAEKKPKMSQTQVIGIREPKASQELVDKLIVNFVVDSMQPFSVVEQPAFISLVTELQPGRQVMTRKTLLSHLQDNLANMKKKPTRTI